MAVKLLSTGVPAAVVGGVRGPPRRRNWLTIRLRDDEHDAVIKAANARGKKVASYARSVILRDSINTDSTKAS